MSLTAAPVEAMSARVPPVETSSTPSSPSDLANSASPVLSKTEISARLTLTTCPVAIALSLPATAGG